MRSDNTTAVASYRRHHHRYSYYGYGRRYHGYPSHGYQSRGFYDPGFAYHGNINGCAVDLGYGRWESCDAGSR